MKSATSGQVREFFIKELEECLQNWKICQCISHVFNTRFLWMSWQILYYLIKVVKRTNTNTNLYCPIYCVLFYSVLFPKSYSEDSKYTNKYAKNITTKTLSLCNFCFCKGCHQFKPAINLPYSLFLAEGFLEVTFGKTFLLTLELKWKS